jgi:O-antigen/teichoic acid export membrane protein
MLKNLVPKSEFGKNVLTLVSGTAAASVLPILAQPLLAKYYPPAEWAPLGLFEGIFSVIAIFATARYELGIVIPEDDDEAAGLVMLCLRLCLLVSFVTALGALVLFLIPNPWASADVKRWLMWLPAAVFMTGANQTANYWCIRKKQFKLMATNRFWRQALVVGFWLLFGFLGYEGLGPILGLVFGQAIGTLLLIASLYRLDGQLMRRVSNADIAVARRRFADFPRYSMAGGVLNTLTQMLPRFFIYGVFGEQASGGFTWVQKFVAAPISILGTTFADVFKQRASEELNQFGHCLGIWTKTFRRLLMVALVPSLALLFAAPWLFGAIMGKGYVEAGQFAQIMIPYLFLGFLASPLSRTLIVAERVRPELFWQIGLFCTTGIGLYFASRNGTLFQTVGAYSLAYSMMYVIYLLMSHRAARGNHTDFNPPGTV